METNIKTTSIFNSYKNAKLINFFGWNLPVNFNNSIIEEHNNVRKNCGVFDVSHMGEIIIKGKEAEKFLDYTLTSNIKTLKENKCKYSFMCYENGGIIDDVILYKYHNYYMLVVNASNIDKDFDWLLKNSQNFDVEISNISTEITQIAIQGPKAQQVLQKITNINLNDLKFFNFDIDNINNTSFTISRSGYTGEDGFEIYTPNNLASYFWNTLLKKGKDQNIMQIGLGARDTLRLEACLPLYGHELNENISPIEANLSHFIPKKKTENYIGKQSIEKQMLNVPEKILIGLKLVDKGIARADAIIYNLNEEKIGFVSSGSPSPSTNTNIALAFINKNYNHINDIILIKRGKKYLKAQIVNTPFYKKSYKK